MPRYVFDIETNGLLDTLSCIHTLVFIDADTGEEFSCADQPGYRSIQWGVDRLAEAGELIGHNIIKFDLPALEKTHGFKPKAGTTVTDTIVLSRLIWPDLFDSDVKRVNKGLMPSYLMGGHSLEAWGYRLGMLKGEFGKDEKNKPIPGIWDHWSQEMQDYGEQDPRVTKALYERAMGHKPSPMSVWLEHRFATILAAQERNGFCFDEKAAGELYVTLVARRRILSEQLQTAFPPITKREMWTPKANNRARGYVKGQPMERVTVIPFNPSSRVMIGQRLQDLGWKPTEFTPNGQPKVDETILEKLPYPEAKLLAEYFLVEKRIGQLAEGDQAWLRLAKNGRIHGSVNTNGAVTGRCTHSNPNVGQVPSVGVPYGAECRALFGPRKGWKLVGIDLSGLELRCLAHFMAKYDGGAYGRVLLEGDIHTVNQQAAGLPTRSNAKTFIYAFLYGAGDVKIGSIVEPLASEDEQRAIGKRLKRSFLKKTPALKALKEAVTKAAERGYLIGLDGRKLKIRSAHAALNTLLQSAGALICKLATVLAYDNLSTTGYQWGRDWALVAHVHDELQIECRKEIADEVGQLVVRSMQEAGTRFDFRLPIDGEAKVGDNWRDTH